MAKYVDVDKVFSEARRGVLSRFNGEGDKILRDMAEVVLKWLSRLLSDAPAEGTRADGEWLWQYRDRYKCSVCGTVEIMRIDFGYGKPMWRYCPDCGAKMEARNVKSKDAQN